MCYLRGSAAAIMELEGASSARGLGGRQGPPHRGRTPGSVVQGTGVLATDWEPGRRTQARRIWWRSRVPFRSPRPVHVAPSVPDALHFILGAPPPLVAGASAVRLL